MIKTDLSLFISGALMLGYWTVALFFLRFWKRSHDRLFAMFSAAFFLMGFQRIALTAAAIIGGPDTTLLWPYVVRLIAFLLILIAIVDKNRASSAQPS